MMFSQCSKQPYAQNNFGIRNGRITFKDSQTVDFAWILERSILRQGISGEQIFSPLADNFTPEIKPFLFRLLKSSQVQYLDRIFFFLVLRTWLKCEIIFI